MPRLEVRSVTKEFPGVRALADVSMQFEPAEVYGIVGENGAGKSTLMKILSGIEQPTTGSIHLDDREIALQGVRHALESGIAMIHQELDVIDDLSVAENVFLGSEKTKFGLLDLRAMTEETTRLLARVGATFLPSTRVADLSIAGKQLIEIAKAVSYGARILIMDEPTAVLTDKETDSLFKLIGELKRDGVCVIYISHRLAEVEVICDKVSVLRDGLLVATLAKGDVSQTKLASLMVGRELQDFFPLKSEHKPGKPLLEAVGVVVGSHVRGVDLKVHAGEILGIAGLVGAGRTELAEAISGSRKMDEGTVSVCGKRIRIASVQDSMAAGIAYVSEDRKSIGLVMGLDVVENITLANLKAYCHPLVDRKKELESAKSWQKQLDIRASDLRTSVSLLSGGNQQKTSVAKWLETKPRVLLLDEPTRGVDVGAKREIYGLIQKLASEGVGCVVISSDLPEIVGVCQRVLVMREGKMVGELLGDQITEEAIMALAAGVVAA